MSDMSVGQMVKQKRTAMGLTQKKLAEIAGVAEITIIYYESDKFKPKIQQLNKLSVALGVPVSEFMKLY